MFSDEGDCISAAETVYYTQLRKPQGGKNMFRIIAVVTLKQGSAEQFRPLIAPLVAASGNDRGNRAYSCTQDALNPDVFVFQEEWESDEALEAHMATPHFKRFSAASEPLLAAPMALYKLML